MPEFSEFFLPVSPFEYTLLALSGVALSHAIWALCIAYGRDNIGMAAAGDAVSHLTAVSSQQAMQLADIEAAHAVHASKMTGLTNQTTVNEICGRFNDTCTALRHESAALTADVARLAAWADTAEMTLAEMAAKHIGTDAQLQHLGQENAALAQAMHKARIKPAAAKKTRSGGRSAAAKKTKAKAAK